MRGWTAISAAVSVRGRPMDVGAERQSWITVKRWVGWTFIYALLFAEHIFDILKPAAAFCVTFLSSWRTFWSYETLKSFLPTFSYLPKLTFVPAMSTWIKHLTFSQQQNSPSVVFVVFVVVVVVVMGKSNFLLFSYHTIVPLTHTHTVDIFLHLDDKAKFEEKNWKKQQQWQQPEIKKYSKRIRIAVWGALLPFASSLASSIVWNRNYPVYIVTRIGRDVWIFLPFIASADKRRSLPRI